MSKTETAGVVSNQVLDTEKEGPYYGAHVNAYSWGTDELTAAVRRTEQPDAVSAVLFGRLEGATARKSKLLPRTSW